MTTTAAPPLAPSLRDPAAFLRAVPALTGCTPAQSLVVVPFADAAALGALRIDLPSGDDPAGEVEQIAATAVGMVCRVTETDTIAVVVYDDEAHWPPDGPLPQERLVEHVIDRAAACGLAVRGAFLVAHDGWGAYGDVAAPSPLSRIAPASAALAHDQHTGAALPLATDAERRAVAFELIEREREFAVRMLLRAGSDAGGADREPPGALPPLDDLPELFERALAWDEARLDAGDAAALALALSRPVLRDAALTQWSSDLDAGRVCLARQLAWRPGAPAEEVVPPGEPLRLAGDGPRPEGSRLRQALALARRTAAVAPPRAQAGALASAAWLSWALGNATHAAHYVEQALEREPAHPFARLLEVLVLAHRLPAWAFRGAGRAT